MASSGNGSHQPPVVAFLLAKSLSLVWRKGRVASLHARNADVRLEPTECQPEANRRQHAADMHPFFCKPEREVGEGDSD